jgi:small subunit ribosomal protein S7
MPRRRVAERREVLPDPIYNSPLVTKFISGVMWGGKKSVAENIFYDAMRQIGDKTGEEPLKVFKRAIDNVKPTVEVKSRRVLPIKSQLKFIRNGAVPWRFVGSFPMRAVAVKRR